MRFDKNLAAAALALGFGAALPAFAQATPPVDTPDSPSAAAPEAPAAGAGAASFSDEKLESFVDAAVVVSEIQSAAVATISEVENEAEQAELVDKANADMATAIESTPGITLNEYVAVASAAEEDPALRQRLEEMIVAAQTE